MWLFWFLSMTKTKFANNELQRFHVPSSFVFGIFSWILCRNNLLQFIVSSDSISFLPREQKKLIENTTTLGDVWRLYNNWETIVVSNLNSD